MPTNSDLSLTLSAKELHELLADIEASGSMPILSAPSDDLTVRELALALGKSESAVRAQMPYVPGAYKFAGKEWRVPRDAWQRYREAHAAPAPPRSRIRLHSAEGDAHPASKVRLRAPLRGDELARAAGG